MDRSSTSDEGTGNYSNFVNLSTGESSELVVTETSYTNNVNKVKKRRTLELSQMSIKENVPNNACGPAESSNAYTITHSQQARKKPRQSMPKRTENVAEFVQKIHRAETSETRPSGDKPELLDRSATELYAMTLKFGLANNLERETMQNLMKFMNKLFQKPIIGEEDMGALNAPTLDCRGGIELHALCKNCNGHLGDFSGAELLDECPRCHEKMTENSRPSSDNMFVLMDPTRQIKELLGAFGAYFDEVMRTTNERLAEDSHRDSVYDGSQYRQFHKVCNKANYLTAVLHASEKPLGRIGQSNVWPLYLVLNELPPEERSRRALCCGLWMSQKPLDLQLYLRKFIESMDHLAKTGMSVEVKGQQRQVLLYVLSCVVDSRTRGRMLGFADPAMPYGCSWCCQAGEQMGHDVFYKYEGYMAPRSHEQIVHIYKNSPVEQPALLKLLHLDLVEGFVPDVVECIKSVASQMFDTYLKLLGPDQVTFVYTQLQAMSPPRRMRTSEQALQPSNKLQWTAQVWENFVLYFSVPILARLLDRPKLNHWMYLVAGLYAVLKDQSKLDELDRAEVNFKQFVFEMDKMYGSKAVGLQVHMLLHLVEAAKRWGPLHQHSSSCFQPAKQATLAALRGARGSVTELVTLARTSGFLGGLEARLVQETRNSMAYHTRDLLVEPRDGYSSSKTRAMYFEREPTAQQLHQQIKIHGLGSNVVAYSKMLKAGYLFESLDPSGASSDANSYGLLADNSCVRIVRFLVDWDTESELVVCQRIDICNFSEDHPDLRLYLVEFVSPSHTVIYAEDLVKVCAVVHVQSHTYLSPLPYALYD